MREGKGRPAFSDDEYQLAKLAIEVAKLRGEKEVTDDHLVTARRYLKAAGDHLLANVMPALEQRVFSFEELLTQPSEADLMRPRLLSRIRDRRTLIGKIEGLFPERGGSAYVRITRPDDLKWNPHEGPQVAGPLVLRTRSEVIRSENLKVSELLVLRASLDGSEVIPLVSMEGGGFEPHASVEEKGEEVPGGSRWITPNPEPFEL